MPPPTIKTGSANRRKKQQCLENPDRSTTQTCIMSTYTQQGLQSIKHMHVRNNHSNRQKGAMALCSLVWLLCREVGPCQCRRASVVSPTDPNMPRGMGTLFGPGAHGAPLPWSPSAVEPLCLPHPTTCPILPLASATAVAAQP
jgi:hypothetical protein